MFLDTIIPCRTESLHFFGGAYEVSNSGGLEAEVLPDSSSLFKACTGLSSQQLKEAPSGVPSVVLESMAQLEQILPASAVVLGLLEGTFRGCRGGISWLHFDEDRTSRAYLQQTLFNLRGLEDVANFANHEQSWQHYSEIRLELQRKIPRLSLPLPSAGEDPTDFTERVLDAIQAYNAEQSDCLCLHSVNVWIPMKDKQLAFLPQEFCDFQLEHGTRPNADEVVSFGMANKFQSFQPTALVFFGRHVLHQVAMGPDFRKCDQGSMETRYLVLMSKGALKPTLEES